MVRLAQDNDIDWLAGQMLLLKQQTGWRCEEGDYSDSSLQPFLAERLHDPLSVCYVWQTNDDLPAAFCGCTLTKLVHPPHMPIMYEWGWSGPKRHAVSCWRACTQWAKKRGAVYGHRVTVSKVTHPRRICESVTWEKL